MHTERQYLARKIVDRTIEIQRIIGPYHSDGGYDDILSQLHAEYRASVDEFLSHQKLRGDAKDRLSAIAVSDGGPGFILTTEAIMAVSSKTPPQHTVSKYFVLNSG